MRTLLKKQQSSHQGFNCQMPITATLTSLSASLCSSLCFSATLPLWPSLLCFLCTSLLWSPNILRHSLLCLLFSSLFSQSAPHSVQWPAFLSPSQSRPARCYYNLSPSASTCKNVSTHLQIGKIDHLKVLLKPPNETNVKHFENFT